MIEQVESTGLKKFLQATSDFLGETYARIVKKASLPIFYIAPKREYQARQAIRDYALKNPNGVTISAHELEVLMGLDNTIRDRFRRPLFPQ